MSSGAGMTLRFPGLSLTPDEVMREAEEFGPFVARIALFSGGGDSTAMLHFALDKGWVQEAAFVDTGTALPGVREHVEQVCADWQVPLSVWEINEGAAPWLAEFDWRSGDLVNEVPAGVSVPEFVELLKESGGKVFFPEESGS